MKDPIRFEGRLNLFGYTANDPINFIDPSGLDWFYQQSTGRVSQVDPNGNVSNVGAGYAGHGSGVNNPDKQNVVNVGPPPQGKYVIQPQQDNTTGDVILQVVR